MVESGGVRFPTDIGETVQGDDCCAGVAVVILGCIFSMLFWGFRAGGLRRIPTSTMTPLTEFFHVNSNVHPLPVSRYFISSSLC